MKERIDKIRKKQNEKKEYRKKKKAYFAKIKNKRYIIEKRDNTKFKLGIYILSLLLLILPFVTTFARYMLNSQNSFFSRTKEFYFLSDKLRTYNPSYNIDNWSGVDPYKIIINMSSKENELLKTSYDIAYSIKTSCSSNAICNVSKSEGVIPGATNTDSFDIDIIPNAQLVDGDEVEVNIRVKSKSKYSKELRAKFILKVGKENITYKVQDKKNSPYMLVKITNTLPYYVVRESIQGHTLGDRISRSEYFALSEEDRKKCSSAEVRVKFDPTKFILDATGENYLKAMRITKQTIGGYEYVNGMDFKVDALTSTNVRLYKKNVSEDNTYPLGILENSPVQFWVIK